MCQIIECKMKTFHFFQVYYYSVCVEWEVDHISELQSPQLGHHFIYFIYFPYFVFIFHKKLIYYINYIHMIDSLISIPYFLK